MSSTIESNVRSQLIDAELDYANFNALRTSVSDDVTEIRRETCNPFSLIVDPTKPDSPYLNRAVLHSFDSATETDFERLPAKVIGVELPVEHSTDTISKAGFKRGTGLIYLTSVPTTESTVNHRVEQFTSDRTDDFFDLLEQSGAKFPEEKRALKQAFYCTEKFRCHVSYTEDGTPTGWATSYMCSDDESVFLANAFTLPEFRGQGFHSDLIKARLNEAISLNRKRVFTDVEPNSTSLRNCERLGFQKVSETIIWER